MLELFSGDIMNRKIKSLLVLSVFFILILGIYLYPIISINLSPSGTPSSIFDNLPTILILYAILAFGFPLIAIFISSRKKKKMTKYIKNIKNLPTTNEFEILCNKIFSQDLSELIKKRKKLQGWFVFQNILVIIFIIIYLCFFTNASGNTPLYNVKSQDIKTFGYLLGIIYAVMTIYITGKLSKYAIEFKNKLITSFIQTLNPNMNFSADIPTNIEISKIYEDSTFDKDLYNRFYVDDYIHDDTNNLQICDVNTKKVTGSGKNRHITNIFQGLFCFTDLTTNNLSYNIKISKNELKIVEETGRVNLDSTEFEKYFDVYCEDRIFATRILTSDVMEKMIGFYNRFKLPFEIAIQNNQL